MKVDSNHLESLAGLQGSWELILYSPNGDRNVYFIENGTEHFEHIKFDWPKGLELYGLLYPPCIIDDLRSYPWGAYLSADETLLMLSPENGASVSVLARLFEKGIKVDGFNMKRFILEMNEIEDPWNCDLQVLSRQIYRQQMRTWYIREKVLFDVEVPLSPGRWYRQSLVRPAVDASGEPVNMKLPEGSSFFYSPRESLLLEYQLNKRGELNSLYRSLTGNDP